MPFSFHPSSYSLSLVTYWIRLISVFLDFWTFVRLSSLQCRLRCKQPAFSVCCPSCWLTDQFKEHQQALHSSWSTPYLHPHHPPVPKPPFPRQNCHLKCWVCCCSNKTDMNRKLQKCFPHHFTTSPVRQKVKNSLNSKIEMLAISLLFPIPVTYDPHYWLSQLPTCDADHQFVSIN